MGIVPFIQYLRPHGETKPVYIEMPEHIAKAADKIRSHGFRFEIEELSTGHVSMTISDDDGDYSIRVCANGPDVPKNVETLVVEFNLAAALKQREQDT